MATLLLAEMKKEMKTNRERLEVKTEHSSETFGFLREEMWTSQGET
jgi:hypothetical protein